MERIKHLPSEDNVFGNQTKHYINQHFPSYQDIEGVYSGRTIGILTLLARGKRIEEVAQAMSFGVSTVKNHLSNNVYDQLGVKSQAGAVFCAANDSILDPLELIEKDHLQYIERLTLKERIVLSTMTVKGSDPTNNGLATSIGVGIHTIKQYMTSIFDKFETDNRISAGMIFLAYEKAKTHDTPTFSSDQMKILLLLMMGMGNDTIRKDLGKTRKEFQNLLYGGLGLYTQLHATTHRELFINALDKKVVFLLNQEPDLTSL